MNYKIAKFYDSFGEKGAESTSAAIIGGLLTMNVMTIGMLVWANMSKIFVVILAVIFQIVTYIRFLYGKKHSVAVTETKWHSKTKSSQRQITVFMFLYVFISVLSCFGTAIYLGGRH